MNRVRSIIALEINPGLSIVGTPPTLTLGAAYSFAFLPNAGQPPYRWAEAGSLPGGVTWTAATATLSATAVSSAGDFPITITLADANRVQVTRAFTLRAVALPLTLSGHVADGTIGGGPSGSYSSSGGYGAKTYAITAGTFPFGLSLNASTGAVTGTYITALHFSWVVTVTDSLGTTASINDSNTVGYATLTLAGPFPDAQVGVPYSQYKLIGGGNGVNSLPTGTATGVDGVDAGALPAGLSLSIVSTTQYLLSGTPTSAGAGSITFSVASGDGQRATHSQTFTVSAGTAYQYFRIEIDDNNGYALVGFALVEIAASIGGAQELLLTATGDCTASSSINGSNLPHLALNASPGWLAATPANEYWQYFHSGISFIPAQLRITCYSGFPTTGPKNFRLKCSNDGVTFTTLRNFTNITGWVSGTPMLWSIP